MKVILLQDVPKIGQKGDVVDVSDGFARNALIPQKKAKQATPGALKAVHAERTRREEERKRERAAHSQAFAHIAGERVETSAKANEHGHLFAGIDAQAIAALLAERDFRGIAAKEIQLKEPVKEVGEHAISLRSDEGEATFTLIVHPV